MNKYETEIPKYLKSTESNISKSNRKSKHKHHYEECLIQNKSILLDHFQIIIQDLRRKSPYDTVIIFVE